MKYRILSDGKFFKVEKRKNGWNSWEEVSRYKFEVKDGKGEIRTIIFFKSIEEAKEAIEYDSRPKDPPIEWKVIEEEEK